jgi:hypothetical protein
MIFPGAALCCPVEEPLSWRNRLKSAYDGFVVSVYVRAVRRDLAQARKPALITAQPGLAMRNGLPLGVHLVLDLKNLHNLVGLRDVFLEQSP